MGKYQLKKVWTDKECSAISLCMVSMILSFNVSNRSYRQWHLWYWFYASL